MGWGQGEALADAILISGYFLLRYFYNLFIGIHQGNIYVETCVNNSHFLKIL